MQPATTAALALAAAALTLPATALAQPEVPDGFTIRRIAPLLDGVRPQLSAIDDPDGFGTGVISAVAGGGVATFRLIEPSGAIRTLGVFVDGGVSQVIRVRLDTLDVFGGNLHTTLALGTAATAATTYVTMDNDGLVVERWRRGGSSNTLTYDFELTPDGFPDATAVLLDQAFGDGTALSTMSVGYDLTLIDADSLPPGRTDTDVWGFQRDVTGAYGGGILLADSDPNNDDITAIYELRVDGAMASYRLIGGTVPTRQRFYGDLAIAEGGPLGGTIFVTEQVTDEIQTVSPDGTHTTWATGFTGIDALSISPDGESMYVADQSGVWLIRETGSEPGPVVLATDPSTPTGSTLGGAPVTSLRVIFNEPVDFTDADVAITDSDGDPVAFDASGSGSQFMLIGLATPLDGDAYTVIIADSVRSVATGEQLDGDRDGIAGGDAELIFTHACPADFDGDGELTLFDFLAFQNAFDAGCP